MWIAGSLFLAGGWVGFLWGLAHVAQAWFCLREGELGLETDLLLRSTWISSLALAVMVVGAVFLRERLLERTDPR